MPAPPPESLPAMVSARRMVESAAMSTGAAATLVGTLSGMRTRASAGDVRSARQVDAFEGTMLRAGAVLFVTVLTALGAQISVPLPFTPVPFTLQPMIVLLGGAALGARLGATAQALYLLVGLAGLPVFAASPMLPQGAARLIGPTAGFLVSYPLAAFVAGWLAERRFDRKYLTSLVAMAAGLAVIFAGGLSWLAYGPTALGLSGAVNTALTPFLAADLVKLCLAAGVLPTVWRFVGRGAPATAARSARRGASLPENQQVLERQGRGAVDQPQPRFLGVLDHFRFVDAFVERRARARVRPCGSRRRRRGRPDAATRRAFFNHSTGLPTSP